MKFLPRKYRESQSDWFGKRGISWHISVVVRRRANQFESQGFVHIIQNCTQGSSAVVSIMAHILRTLKSEHPEINQAFFRQDNAGCYHSSYCGNLVQRMGRPRGLTPLSTRCIGVPQRAKLGPIFFLLMINNADDDPLHVTSNASISASLSGPVLQRLISAIPGLINPGFSISLFKKPFSDNFLFSFQNILLSNCRQKKKNQIEFSFKALRFKIRFHTHPGFS